MPFDLSARLSTYTSREEFIMADIARFTLNLNTAERTPATEPNCFVAFNRTDNTTIV